ncbi:MAG: lamin tail domain-containing protein [Anaerolineae bacterium]
MPRASGARPRAHGAVLSRRRALHAAAAAAAIALAASWLGACSQALPPGASDRVADVRINEVLAANASVGYDEAGEFDDWIELHNAGADAVDLSGYLVSDNRLDLARAVLPPGFTIPAGGFAMLWADGQPEQGPTHLGFKLNAAGEAVYLSSPDLVLVDSLEFADAPPDVSFARFPDGRGAFVLCAQPSPDAANGAACGGGSTESGGGAEAGGGIMGSSGDRIVLLASYELDGPRRPSGLAFAAGRLFAVGDGSSDVHVLTADGRIVRVTHIPLPPDEEESIEGLAANGELLHLALEPSGQIVTARADDGVVTGRVTIPDAIDGDDGLEGLALAVGHGSSGTALRAAKEDGPALLYEVDTTSGSIAHRTPLVGLPDVSGLAPFCGGGLLAVSQEGATLNRLSAGGLPLESWVLPVRSAEGVAFDGASRAYVVDEEADRLLVFGVDDVCEEQPAGD